MDWMNVLLIVLGVTVALLLILVVVQRVTITSLEWELDHAQDDKARLHDLLAQARRVTVYDREAD